MWAEPLAINTIILLCLIAGANSDSELEFLSEPTSRLVKISDGRAAFRCNVSPPNAEVRWLLKGQPILHNRWIKVSGYKLMVQLGRMDKNSRLSHHIEHGYFQCEARLKGKVLVSAPAKLIVAVLEQFPAQADVHITAIRGNTAVIPCDPPHSVPTVITEFKFNDTIIDRSSEHRHLMSSGDLQIFNADLEDAGVYECIANNPFLAEKVYSKRKVTLHIVDPSEPKAPSFIKSPRTRLSVALGSNITLECIATGYPVPEITWRRHHGKLPHNRYQQIGGNLHIYSVRRGDEGFYFCEANNSIGEMILTSTTIDVQETPQILRAPKSLTVEIGQNFTLHCAARGHPAPHIMWIHNGKAINPESHTKNKGSQLALQNVNHKHSGVYQCFASNDLGTVYATAFVTVISGNRSIDVDYDADDYDYDESSISSPTFYRDKKKHRPKDHLPDGDGSKTSKGSNIDFDPDTIVKRTHKKKYPKGVKLIPPSRPEVTRLSDTSVMVRWGVPRNDGLPILFFKVQYREVGRRSSQWMTIDEDIAAHIHSYAVTNLRTGGKYRFRIAAVYSNNDNKLGPNSAKFILHKEPPMKKPSAGPMIAHAEAASPSAITLNWKYDDLDSIPIEGFFIYYRATHNAGDYLKVTVLGANTRSHIISHLLPETSYDIKMQCFNIAGTSDFSNIYTSKTKPSEVSPNTRNRNSKSHHYDDVAISVTEPVSSKNADGNFVLYVVLGVVSSVLLVAVSVFVALFIRQKQNRHPTTGDESDNDIPVKIGNGHINSNGYISVASKMNISVNPLSHLDSDESEKPEDFENLVSNNNEIIRLQTFSVSGEPHDEPLLTSNPDESNVDAEETTTVILPSDSGDAAESPEDI